MKTPKKNYMLWVKKVIKLILKFEELINLIIGDQIFQIAEKLLYSI
jgi:hypothetical protein